ncbi:PucR family transcriptional regulator [Acrocarpospora catenulata]|uniref:PucR family transcriptional regulator n=1 Tax=Acrocarpospora catenulata TaxID=2836182 RepID=UPI001BD9CFFD|nr:helix-turn-helix domain-containing protein [Acrocarpospora catenulata]
MGETFPRTPATRWLLELTPPEGEPVEPLSDAPTRTLAATELGPGPVAWGVVTARRAADHIIVNLPAFGGDLAAEQLLRRAVESTTLAMLRAFLHGDIEALWPGAEPADATTSYVRRGIPLGSVLRGIHLCQEIITRGVLAEIELRGLPVTDAQAANELLFRCFDLFSANIVARYSLEAQRWSRSTAALRAELIDNVLSGSVVDANQVSAALGYQLDGAHVASVVWLDAPYAQAGAEDELEAALDRLDRRLGGATSLRRWTGPSTVHIWHADRGGNVYKGLRSLAESPLPARRARMALGGRARGVAGFRSSHGRALLAARVAALAGPRLDWLCDYADVELVALLTGDLELARSFVQRMLGPLAEDSPRASELRETLAEYLEVQRSVAQTARHLHTHRNTVVYRVKKIETLLGKELSALPRVELQVALRTVAVLGEVVLDNQIDEEERWRWSQPIPGRPPAFPDPDIRTG